jgi:2-polyprenyl-6-methoxyphenol hydroxylase-like FAD-dependent oxidoreductase
MADEEGLAADQRASVLIVGAGIAGLTTAIALSRAGIDSLVFEQADDVGECQVGSGLALGYNVGRAFDHLGILEPIMERSSVLTGLEFITDRGKPVATAADLSGELALGILRPALHGFLADTCGSERVRLGAKLVRFEQDEAGVTAQFSGGRTARGDVLIGADGLRSTVRTQLLGNSEPSYRGYCTRRGILKTDLPQRAPEKIYLGRGERFLFYPVGQGYVYWTAATNEPSGGKEDGAEIKRKVIERFGDWPDPIESLVRNTQESDTFLSDTVDRDWVKRWGEGRVTLLGDAAHPMTWDRGQGASQAIEGAVLLARHLERADDRVAGLRAWEAERIPRTTKVVRSSRVIGKLQQSRNPIVGFLHHQAIKVELRPYFFQRANKDLLVEY